MYHVHLIHTTDDVALDVEIESKQGIRDVFGQRSKRRASGFGAFGRVSSAGMAENNVKEGKQGIHVNERLVYRDQARGQEPEDELRTPSPPFFRTPSDGFVERRSRRPGGAPVLFPLVFLVYKYVSFDT